MSSNWRWMPLKFNKVLPMSLVKLDATNIRNIESATLNPSPHLNVIVGPNGSGKTSLLEAIYILGRARSFRSTQASQVIRFEQEDLLVTGRVGQGRGLPPVPIGIQLGRRKREIMLAGAKLLTSAELIRTFPVLLIQPSSSNLLDGPPKIRRQFLDWGAFYLDSGFLEQWRGYARALNQRNALLRSGDCRNIETWNHELARYGTMLASARAAYAERLLPYFLAATQHFLGVAALELRLSLGWEAEKNLDEILREEIALDLRDGYTHAGPHKGDFSIYANKRSAKNYFSRGQSKLLVFALLLAQAHMLEESLEAKCTVLIDDLASELDRDNRARLLAFLQSRKSQFFITATDPLSLDAGDLDTALFHVEQGRVKTI
jgi:DNA replication and repair protein RecF